jgi:hypothetical protein
MEWSKNEIGRIKDYAGLVPRFMGMEEGRPVVTVVPPEDEEIEDLELNRNAEDDRPRFLVCASRDHGAMYSLRRLDRSSLVDWVRRLSHNSEFRQILIQCT